MKCEHCNRNCGNKVEVNSSICKHIYRPNDNGLKEIIAKQRQTISRLREEIKLLKEIKHIEFLKQITKERDLLIAERIINKTNNQKDKTMNNETKVTIENYQELAMRTCLPSAKNWEYATHNYRAELFELLAKIESFQAKQIRDGADFDKAKYLDKIADELGDCYWQIALICELRGERFHENIEDKFKYERYDIIGITDCQNDYGDVENEFGRLDVILRMFDFDILEILQRNIDKLASRAERGVLKGNGDER